MTQAFAPASLKQPIDRMTAAESIATILGRVNVEKFPYEERVAAATAQIAAIEEWLDAYLEKCGAKRRPGYLS
jgi:mono/diheme cytochrome c family protein